MDTRQMYFMTSAAIQVPLLLSFFLMTKIKFLGVILKIHGLEKVMATMLEAAFYFLFKMIIQLNQSHMMMIIRRHYQQKVSFTSATEIKKIWTFQSQDAILSLKIKFMDLTKQKLIMLIWILSRLTKLRSSELLNE